MLSLPEEYGEFGPKLSKLLQNLCGVPLYHGSGIFHNFPSFCITSSELTLTPSMSVTRVHDLQSPLGLQSSFGTVLGESQGTFLN